MPLRAVIYETTKTQCIIVLNFRQQDYGFVHYVNVALDRGFRSPKNFRVTPPTKQVDVGLYSD